MDTWQATTRSSPASKGKDKGVAMKVHKGWIVAFAGAVLLSGAVTGAPGQTKELTVDELVAKVIAARGGIEKIRGIQAQRVTGTISFGPGADGPFAVELKRPGKMRMELTLQGMNMVRSYDGRSAGWANNPFIGKKDVEPMTEVDLKNIGEESDFDGPLVDYKAKGNEIKLVGKDTVEGKRSEEHTSELQSRLHLVCRLLLEKKKQDFLQHPLW